MHLRNYLRGLFVAGLCVTTFTVCAQAPVFLKATFNKPACFLREPILVEYTLFTRTSTDVHITREPVFPNATLLAADFVDTTSARNVTVDGVPYEARVVYRRWLLPLVQGTLRPGSMVISYKAPQTPAPGSSLQDLMNQTDKDQAAAGKGPLTTGHSPALAINVLPLPTQGQPGDFSGAVGQFSIKTDGVPTGLIAGRLAHLQLTVTGRGTLLPDERPLIAWPADLSADDVTAADKALLPPQVSRVITYAFTAQGAGRHVLPPIAFTYFDPETHAYKTIRTDSLSFVAAPASAGPPGTPEPAGRRPFPYLWVGIALVALLLCVLLLRKKRVPTASPTPPPPVVEAPVVTGSYRNEPLRASETHLATPAPAPTPEAAPPSDGPFSQEAALLAAGEYNAFYKTLQEDLWTAIAGGPGPFPGAASARARLEFLGWDEGRIGEAMAIFSVCAVSLYTPVHQAEDATGYLERARAIAETGGKYRSGPGS